MPTPFRALKDKNFRGFFLAQLISMSGTWTQGIAQSWLVYKLTHSGWWLGVIMFCNHFPAFVVSPIAGVFADRGERRHLLMVTQCVQITQALVLAGLVFTHLIQPWHIAVLAFLLGIMEGIDITVRHTITPDLVQRKDLPGAIALQAVNNNLSRILGPTIAGIVIGTVGDAWCFVVNAVSFFPMIFWLITVRLKRNTAGSPESTLKSALITGVAYVLKTPFVFRLIALSTFVCIVLSMYTALLPIIAKSVLKGDAQTLAWLTGMLGLGSVGGALLFGRTAAAEGQRYYLKRSVLTFGIGILGLALATRVEFASAAMFTIGFSQMGIFPRINLLLNHTAIEQMRGRVMAVYTMTFMGTVPFGALISGWCADRVGAPMVTAVAGLIAIAGGGALYWMERGEKIK